MNIFGITKLFPVFCLKETPMFICHHNNYLYIITMAIYMLSRQLF